VQHATLSACRHSTASAVLGWATCRDLRYEQLPVQVQQHPQYGRCLVALQDIAADEVILSVPTDRVFASQVSVRPAQTHAGARLGAPLPEASSIHCMCSNFAKQRIVIRVGIGTWRLHCLK
jgi:hypothetical protein